MIEDFAVLPVLFACIGMLLAVFACFSAIKSLRIRLSLEKKLAQKLASELAGRGIKSKIDIEKHKLTVTGHIQQEDLDEVKAIIDDALGAAIASLMDEERILIERSLEQPSKQGQTHYLNKIVSNSLEELQHQQARC